VTGAAGDNTVLARPSIIKWYHVAMQAHHC